MGNTQRHDFTLPSIRRRSTINAFSGISGIKHIKPKNILKKERDDIEEDLLDVICQDFDIPVKHTSKVINYSQAKNKPHESNDEQSNSVLLNFDRSLAKSSNPNFDRKLWKTKHADYLTGMSLLKLGQLDEAQMTDELVKHNLKFLNKN